MTTNQKNKKSIKKFTDLKVYENLYDAAALVIKKIAFGLPESDTKNQLNRGCKKICALVIEEFAQKSQRNSGKHLDKAIKECGEMIIRLRACQKLYPKLIDAKLCKKAISVYNQSSKQLSVLKNSWKHSK